MIPSFRKVEFNVKNQVQNIGTKKIAAILLILAAVFSAYKLYIGLNITREKLPEYKKEGLSSVISRIQNNSGMVLVASSKEKQLSIDTSTLNFKVVDTSTGSEWNSLYTDANSGDVEKSPLIIRYLGKDSTTCEWDAYKYCIQNGKYTINKINNGVQIIFDFSEAESYNLDQYMPAKISIKNYENRFINKLDQMVSKGQMTSAQADDYKSDLEITYQEDTDNKCYFNKYSGIPPLSLVKQLIELSKAVGYTTKMLLEDSSEFGIKVEITKPARFLVTMEATLDNGDLVVKIPTYEIKSGNGFYTMQNISVLPSLGLAAADKVSDGYIFVPDGSGALFKLNTFNGKYPEYERPVYNSTYYDTLYNMPEFPEDIHMPVFGMYNTDLSKKTQGLMGIIEKGAELSYIKVQLGSKDTSTGGTTYNKVYSSFDASQYSRVKVFGPYSDNDARFLASTGIINVDYTIRYKLFVGNVTYYDMAKEYRDYLIKKYNIKVAYDKSPKLFFDVIGTLTLKKRFLGIPYNKNVSMTSYKELLNIMKDLGNVNEIVNYKGVFNNGLNNTISNKANLVKANGSKKEFDSLINYFDKGNSQLFLNADLMRITDTSGGFRLKKDALIGYDGKPVEFMKYNYATGIFNLFSNKQYLLNPLILSDTVDKFIKASKQTKNIFVNDIGSTFYSNYNPREIVNPVAAEGILDENLKKLSKNKIIALDNPNSDKICYAKYAANISRESSDYGTIYCSVPFRQLVMNGLTEYTTLDVNMSSDRNSYFLLQALELGSIPKFTICSKNVDVLKYTEYTDYYSTQYSKLRDKIKAFYGEYRTALSQIGSKEITGHSMLAKNVFETTYASGVSVIVNYNKFKVSVQGRNLEPLGYIILIEH